MVDSRRRTAWTVLAKACKDAGVAGIELGFPFSDPIADGPVLQEAAARALRDHTRWPDLLQALRSVSRVLPVAVMTYANPVLRRKLDRACSEVAGSGATGLIVPDLALEESATWRRAARRAGLSLVLMGSPATSAPRIQTLARATSGFLYLVSRFGTTGRGRRAPGSELRGLVAAVHSARPELPVLVGFGVRSASDLAPIRATGADGAIVGTAVEEVLAESAAPERLRVFLRQLNLEVPGFTG
jgi:tryptophan synthase alpha chain